MCEPNLKVLFAYLEPDTSYSSVLFEKEHGVCDAVAAGDLFHRHMNTHSAVYAQVVDQSAAETSPSDVSYRLHDFVFVIYDQKT